MDKEQSKVVFDLTSKMHDNITEIYESSVEGEIDDAVIQIDKLREELKNLKDNLINKDEI